MGDGPVSTTYRDAPEVEEVAEPILREHHPELYEIRDRIRFVFVSPIPIRGGKNIWGRCRKVSGLNAFLARDDEEDEDGEPFFVIEIAEGIWSILHAEARRALVDHELCHATTGFDGDGNLKLEIVPHDLEEFTAVVGRHGIWRPEIEKLIDAAEDAPQRRPRLPFAEDDDGGEG